MVNCECRVQVDTLWIISLVNGVVCTLLAVGKFYLSYILKSLVVFTDGTY